MDLFEDNLSLVYKVYQDRLASHDIPHDMLDDLIQVGRIALWNASVKYDPSWGTAFSTYAYSAIYKSSLHFLIREMKKRSLTVSFNTVISVDRDGMELTYEDVLFDEADPIAGAGLNELLKDVVQRIGGIAPSVLEGMLSGETQIEIAKRTGKSQPQISRIVSKIRSQLRRRLQE